MDKDFPSQVIRRLRVAKVVEVQLVLGLDKGDPRDSLVSAPRCANGGVEAIDQFLPRNS